MTPDNELLLIRIEKPEGSWNGWITPGGGIEESENNKSALSRELREELGADLTIGSEVWIRSHTFPWKGKIIEQHEVFYLIHTIRFKPNLLSGIADFIDLKEFRWWKIDELKNAKENFAPSDLYNLIHDLIKHGPPDKPSFISIMWGMSLRINCIKSISSS